jgi:hypothetical protein
MSGDGEHEGGPSPMTGAEVVAGLRSADPGVREQTIAAAYRGEVQEIEPATLEIGFLTACAGSYREASAGAWLVFAAARDGLAIDGAALAAALRRSLWPDWLVRAARELAWRGPLPEEVLQAIPWPFRGDKDVRRMCARVLSAHAIAADDGALAGRLLADRDAEFRFGVHAEAIESVTKRRRETEVALRLLAHAASRGPLREQASAALADLRESLREHAGVLLAADRKRSRS